MDRHEFRAARKRIRRRQYELADELGVHKTTVNRWESGAIPLPLWAQKALARIVEMSASEIAE